MQKMKVLAQFYDPLTPCAKIFTVIKKFAPPLSKRKALGQKKVIFLLFYVAPSFFNQFLHVIYFLQSSRSLPPPLALFLMDKTGVFYMSVAFHSYITC